jgi:hypothetical protein
MVDLWIVVSFFFSHRFFFFFFFFVSEHPSDLVNQTFFARVRLVYEISILQNMGFMSWFLYFIGTFSLRFLRFIIPSYTSYHLVFVYSCLSSVLLLFFLIIPFVSVVSTAVWDSGLWLMISIRSSYST